MFKFDPDRPYIICEMGTGQRDVVMNTVAGERSQFAVVRSRAHGEILRKVGYEWADYKRPKSRPSQKLIVSVYALHKLFPLHEGETLIATDYLMLSNPKTKCGKVFRASGKKVARYCVAAGFPNPWATTHILRALGVYDREFRATYQQHAHRLSTAFPTHIQLRDPDRWARDSIYRIFDNHVKRIDQ